jgi:hypothetical protein
VHSRRLVVLGTLASDPYAGMAWMHMQIAVGLRRLGHDVSYVEATSAWPYDPIRQARVCDSDYAVTYLARVAASFGLGDCWAYRRSYFDNVWLGPRGAVAEDLLVHADAVFNIAGSTYLTKEGLKIGRHVYFGTDPVRHELEFAKGDGGARAFVDSYTDCVTYGENIGNPDCVIPPLPRLRSRTRQPILLDFWYGGPPSRAEFTTVCNWRQTERDIEYQGEVYYWSKHHEFLKFIDVPRHIDQPIELAMPLHGLSSDERKLLESSGWRLTQADAFTTDPWAYREYVRTSRGEFTVAKDQNVRLRSGWFSERSACYLAAGRPVVTQDTGLSTVLPTGEGLFAFNTMEDILTAFEAIHADYDRQSRAARRIAEEYFRAETVLAKVVADLGL